MRISPKQPALAARLVRAATAIAVVGLVLSLGGVTSVPAAPAIQSTAPSDTGRVHLPLALAGRTVSLGPVADAIWEAVVAFTEAHPPEEVYPGYDAAPSEDAARRSVEAACHDFPTFNQHYEGLSHRYGCHVWVPEYLGVMHAAAARRLRTHPGEPPLLGMDRETHLAWTRAYLQVAVPAMSRMVWAPRRPNWGFRDTRIAVWQNPHRIVETVVLAELLRQEDPGDSFARDMGLRAAEISVAAAVAWREAWTTTGVHPSHGVTLTTATAGPEDPVIGRLGAAPIVPTRAYTFTWDADRGNSPIEEVLWMGAGAMLAARVAGEVLPDAEREALAAAGRRWVDFAWTDGRPDPIHGGVVRTLNLETEGGAHGQRRLWIENHAADVPAIPYLGWAGLYLGAALLASPEGRQRPWPSLIADDAHWRAMRDSAEATLHAPDGRQLVDWTPGAGLGYDVEDFPGWTTRCGELWLGHPYVRYDGRAGGPAHYVSEIGHPAGLDLLTAGWPLARIAADRGDWGTWSRWVGRMRRVAAEYAAHPPEPLAAVCGVAPYVSHNEGYHWGRMLSMMTLPWLGASGFEVNAWPQGEGAGEGGDGAPAPLHPFGLP